MLDELLGIANFMHSEDYGSLCLTRIELSESAITLSLHISADRYPDIHSHWQVVCLGVREHRLSLGHAYQFQLLDDHVLLWPFMARRLSTYFYGKCDNPAAVVGALYDRHWELAGEWIPLHRFLNSRVRLMKLITSGAGMLAEGPQPLILAYEDVMQESGFSTSHVDAGEATYWDGETWLEERAKLSALVLDNSYVVAENFIAKAI